jgi:bifunctional non-homologous end joining protein LigD
VEASRVPFIPRAIPRLRASPPAGDAWQYEVKFDGGDLTRRFPTIAAKILALQAKSFIIDGELIAAGAHGRPDFLALLHGSRAPVCVYAFDPMRLRGRDLRDQPLYLRRGQLNALLARSGAI